MPFVLTNDHVASIETTKDKWLGSLDLESSFTWVDLLLAMVKETKPHSCCIFLNGILCCMYINRNISKSHAFGKPETKVIPLALL